MALLLGRLGLALSTIWGPLGGPFAWAAARLLKLTKSDCFLGSGQPWGHRFVVGPAWGWVLVFYVVLVCRGRRAGAERAAGTLQSPGRASRSALVAAPGLGLPGLAASRSSFASRAATA